MNIVFMGSPDFAIPSLLKINNSHHNIVSVVSGADKRRGRGGQTSPTPVKAKAQELNLPTIEVENLSDAAFIEQLKSLNADLFVVVAFRILPPAVLEIPRKGSVNLHASLLPKYRGAAPIHHAIMQGEEQTGCTVFLLDKKVDTGAVINQQKTDIGPNETTGDVYNRLKEMGSELLLKSLDDIETEDYSTHSQDDDKATGAPKIFKDDCRVNFNHPAQQVHNKIRGLSPFPTAWAMLDGLKFNMYRSQVGPDKSLKPGQLQMSGDELLVGCGEGAVVLEEVQLQGKKRMSGKAFMNGYSGVGMIH